MLKSEAPLMKKYFLILVFFGFIPICNAQINWGPDKPKHIAAGIVAGGVGGYAAHKIFRGDRRWTWAGAVGSSLAAGVAKEMYDKSTYGVWETQDIIFTTLGGIVSGLALDLLLKNDGRRRRGKPCSCYALQIRYSESNNSLANIDLFENGSHDIGATLSAQAILSNGSNLHR